MRSIVQSAHGGCSRPSLRSTNGGGGIRTHEGPKGPQRFSRPPRSTTPAPLRDSSQRLARESRLARLEQVSRSLGMTMPGQYNPEHGVGMDRHLRRRAWRSRLRSCAATCISPPEAGREGDPSARRARQDGEPERAGVLPDRRLGLAAGRVARRSAPAVEAPAQRRSAKNARSRSLDSAASSPPATSGRWLSRGSPSTSSTPPAAPALGSSAP
jgi:hypothetical protein